MLAAKSTKTSLLDLSIDEIRQIAWLYMNVNSFQEDMNNTDFLRRAYLADKELLVKFLTDDDMIRCLSLETINFILEMLEDSLSELFDDDKISRYIVLKHQLPIEFLERYATILPLYHAEHQLSITPEFYSKYHSLFDDEAFWGHFASNHTSDFNTWATYNDGELVDKVFDNSVTRYFTKAKLIEHNMMVPNFYDNVVNEQRIMAGDPCSDGQRSYAIWLRKYRRTYNDQTGYPTWGQLLELFEKHPRMNHDGYIDWLFNRVVRDEFDEDDVSISLEIDVQQVDEDEYEYEYGEKERHEDDDEEEESCEEMLHD
ncbi:hypothetical protein [Yersinia phage fHe-Yen9-04]|uniref:Uncharacterized protein n=1 Tax=Yersinia phage fHe-Yen9-04 TaxID=2052742 RepID=A0A2C9D0E7_9CAUD|nr:hypothetical protein FDJ41_gp398 [Yersinia phage fHe-Yen9-04]SOK58782.1 hypothetical protein [Yersinia phage fHe-Yen9-04]VUE36551.1 hypothetical protein [Yersinia phage fHe-Yen9-04]